MSAHTAQPNEDTALAHFGAAAWIPQPHGKFLIDADSARDFAHMRADQLSSLLLLMRLDDARSFRNISEDRQLDLMWLASQLADDLRSALPNVVDEVYIGAKA